MANTYPRALGRLVAIVALTGAMQGCVVWEIRDGIREANSSVAAANRRVGEAGAQVELARYQIADASAQITRADVAIETANSKLDTATERIVSAENRIESTERRIESTERRLEDVEGVIENRITQVHKIVADVAPDLERLHSIAGSLQQVDAHLRSVRKTLASLSDQMPFFELDSDPIDSAPAPVAAADPGAEAPAVAAPARGAASDEASAPVPATPAPKRELLLGTWLREHPSAGVALVILEDGTYILDADGPQSERGTWKRDGDSVVFTPTTLAPTPPPAPGQPASPPQPRPERKYKVLGRAVRVLTLDGEGGVLVYSRP